MRSSFVFKVAEEVQNLIQFELGFDKFVSVSAIPRKTVKELGKLTITVCPRSESFEQKARGVALYTAVVEVGVQKKISDDSEIDEVASVAERVAEILSKNAIESAAWISIEIDPILDAAGIEADGVATSVIRATYQGMTQL